MSYLNTVEWLILFLRASPCTYVYVQHSTCLAKVRSIFILEFLFKSLVLVVK